MIQANIKVPAMHTGIAAATIPTKHPLLMFLILFIIIFSLLAVQQPNGLRYPLVGGWDSTRKQKNIEARKILENAAESHQSGARFVRRF
jgi:hypothetical protein